MRVVLDLQAFPGPAARHKRADDYGASLARAMIRHAGNHDIQVVVNHQCEDAIEELQNKFPDLVGSANFRVWQLPFSATPGPNGWRCGVAELLREQWVLRLKPDVILSSLMTGTADARPVSKLRLATVPTATTLYELFPSLNSDRHVSDPSDSDPSVRAHWARRTKQLRETDLVMTVSEYCRSQLLDALDLRPERVVVIPPAADVRFRRFALPTEQERALRLRFALNRDFVMSVGGTAYRKNVEGLIEAYALLPFELRKGHQLALVGRLDADESRRLQRLARSKGLADDELIVTRYVNDDDLANLYSICKGFVSPSLREDFPLPLLEAMSCGAPVIGSDRSSISEVVDLPEALFDPLSAHCISKKIYEVLTDTEFRVKLKSHGLERAQKFSWERSARRALEALETLQSSRRETRKTHPPSAKSRPRLAYLSPLPPERSGIADYSAELLPELAKYYEIDLITDLTEIADPYLQESFRRQTISEFENSAHRYDRVLYQIGNSPFHCQMPSLIERYPGTVVLHDFFLSHLFYYLEGVDGTALRRCLYESHGYPGLLTRARKGAEAAVWSYPCNLSVLSRAQGIIVHSEHAKQLAREWFGISAEGWAVIPQLRRIPKSIRKEDARRVLGIPSDTFLVCSFGFLAPTKLNELLFESWLASSLASRRDCHLLFVGGDGNGEPYQVEGSSGRIRVTGYVGKDDYERYLSAADVGVQLRGPLSRGETPRSVFDCMSHGLATVVTAHPALEDLPADSLLTLSESSGAGELVGALERLYRDPEYRTNLCLRAQQYVRDKLAPALIARPYADAIEKFSTDHPVALTNRLIAEIADLPCSPPPSHEDLAKVATCIAEDSSPCVPRQLLVDVTVLVSLGDYQTGIQRVTRAILSQLLENPPTGYRVELVFRPFSQTYRYARKFACKSLGLEPLDFLEDAPVTVNPGDIFLGLDWDPGIDDSARKWLLHNRQRGMKTFFTIYDLLPLRRGDWFKPEMGPVFRGWLLGICQVADGLVCISRAVADELSTWLDTHQPAAACALDIGYFHLGCDIEASWPSRGLSSTDQTVLADLKGREVLVMVGTIEPRKGHSQALSAMERLWAEGEDVSLLICGKQGWMVESMAQRLHSHAELGRRLFWLDQAGDEALLQLYSIASGMLMASEGEGFGLPLVEAARHGVPIIARDLPVFREVSGEHGFYFSGTDPADLADALRTWLKLYRRGEHPKSDDLHLLTWEESTRQLLCVVQEGKLYKRWQPARTLSLDKSEPQTADGRSAEPERESVADLKFGTDSPQPAPLSLPPAQVSPENRWRNL
jgi:glycosyltransferase involved in cell wall biosynthesis